MRLRIQLLIVCCASSDFDFAMSVRQTKSSPSIFTTRTAVPRTFNSFAFFTLLHPNPNIRTFKHSNSPPLSKLSPRRVCRGIATWGQTCPFLPSFDTAYFTISTNHPAVRPNRREICRAAFIPLPYTSPEKIVRLFRLFDFALVISPFRASGTCTIKAPP